MRQEVIETRINPVHLAECVLAFESQGIPLRSKSSIVSACVDTLADVLKQNGIVPQVEDTECAQAIIERALTPKLFNPGSLLMSSIQQSVAEAVNNLNKTQ